MARQIFVGVMLLKRGRECFIVYSESQRQAMAGDVNGGARLKHGYAGGDKDSYVAFLSR